MKKKIVAWMLTILVAVTFVPEISFGVELGEELASEVKAASTDAITINSVSVNKDTVHWYETIEFRVDYTADKELDQSDTHSFSIKSDNNSSFNLYDRSSDDDIPCFSVRSSYDEATSKGTYILSVTIFPRLLPCGTYHLTYFSFIYDGNRSSQNLVDQNIAFTVLPLYESVAYCGTTADDDFVERLGALEDGDVAALFVYGGTITDENGDERYAEVFRKEYFDAIDGKDVTCVIPISDASYCEINGKDIINETKDIILGSNIFLAGGGSDEEGDPWCAFEFCFPDNGLLPGEMKYYYRYQNLYKTVKKSIDSRIITAEDVLTDMKLYYVTAGMLVLEEDALLEEQDWIVLVLNHNSSFVASKFAPAVMRSFEASVSQKSFVYNGKIQKPKVAVLEGCSIKYSNASSKNAGKYTITVGAPPQGYGKQTLTYTILKARNTMKVKPLTATVKYSKLKKKNQKLLQKKVMTLSKAKGKVTFVKTNGNKKISIAKTTGKVTIKKGLKKGTYKVKVKITAAGNTNYKAKTLYKTFTIRVK